MGRNRPGAACAGGWDSKLWRAAAVALPVVLTMVWIPLRDRLPNVDLALVLVLAVSACGATGRRSVVALAALGAAAGFAFFDTEPYEHFVISRQPDIETLAVLVVVALVAGELAVRVALQRVATRPRQVDMDRVRDLAAFVASGAELVEVIGAVAGSLTQLLGGSSAEYEAGASARGAVVITRDGVLARVDAPGRVRFAPPPFVGAEGIEVPVTGLGQVLGRFRVAGTSPTGLGHDRLVVALTLADQVGAALIAQAPESATVPGPAPDPSLRPRLKVVD